MNLLKVVNQFRVRLYWKSIFFAYGKPFLLSLWFLAVYFFVFKILWSDLSWWHILPVMVSLGVAYYFGSKRFESIKFTETELAALVDKKLQAGGTYMAFDDNGGKQTAALHMIWASKFSDVRQIESNSFGTQLRQFFILACFFALVFFAPISINRPWVASENKDVFLKESEDLSYIDKLMALDPALLDVMKKELSDLQNEYKEKGLSKELWDKKSNLNKMMENAIEDQLHLEQQQMERLNEIAKDMIAGQEMSELLDKMNKLEKELMQKNKAPDAGQEEMKELLAKVDALAKDPKNKELLEQMTKGLGDLQKKIEGQNGEARKALEINPKNIKEAKIAKDAIEKLKELAENIEKAEEAELVEGENGSSIKVGDGGISRGPGTAEIQHSNQNEEETKGKNKETVEVSNYFNSKGEVLSTTEGEHQKAIIDKQKNAEVKYVDTKTDLIFKENVNPHRRKVIKEYFKTSKE